MKSRDTTTANHRCAPPACKSAGFARLLLVMTMLVLGPQAAQAAQDIICTGGTLGRAPLSADLPDLQVKGSCFVPIGQPSYYRNVNVLDGGTLHFYERTPAATSKTDFWAGAIIIESGGAMVANAESNFGPPFAFGSHGGVLVIHLYGRNEAQWNAGADRFSRQNLGALCKSAEDGVSHGPCGIPWSVWDNKGDQPVALPGGVNDYFYRYGPLYGDARCENDTTFDASQGACPGSTRQKPVKAGYFGDKVLAVSYGATLNLQGYKGATPASVAPDADPLSSGTSWRRLADGQSLAAGATSLFLEKDAALPPALTWSTGDEIVVTSTDYLASHSEKLKVTGVDSNAAEGIRIGVAAVDSPTQKVQWPHNGVRYGGASDTSGPANDPGKNRWTRRLEERVRSSLDPQLVTSGAETRAAVALLSRSIQIVSAGDVPDVESNFGFHQTRQCGGREDANYAYGAHMVVRQGAKLVQIRGVEFRQMGQGGRKGHYPVHFHMARKTPENTYVKDSSINESMTRWVVLHSTQGVTLARNVGYKSIGHGFYLEDGTEADNKFYSNIGILARAAIANKVHNPRSVPGILADNQDPERPEFKSPNVANPGLPYRSDVEYPTIFWITNGWNDFIGNMAAGTGTCGAAYWLVPTANMNMAEVTKYKTEQTWSGYAGLQKNRDYVGATPLRSFYKNYASSTMHSFQTTADAPPCYGVIAASATPPADFPVIQALASSAPKPLRIVVDNKKDPPHTEPDAYRDHFYPRAFGGIRHATHCPYDGRGGYDCSTVKVCAHGPDANKEPANQCGVTVVDHFTTGFHWTEGNVSAVWLRSNWYLFTNSVISDVQNGGLTFVSGGDYTRSSIPAGYWALARNSVFIGHTNNHPDPSRNNPYARDIGPVNAATKTDLKCARLANKGAPSYCLLADHGISMPTSTFFTNQRLANIYDGPSYQDALAYLDITTTDCPFKLDGDCMYGKGPAFLLLRRQPDNPDPDKCYVPNAAIGWKQPNGFFYPPAFHTRNLFFDNVELRHYVIDPLFVENTYITDSKQTHKHYCTGSTDFFNNWTSIDRQTELNDDDGSLTGLSNTIGNDRPEIRQTISINDDAFFSAPVETAECASSVGANTDAASACALPQSSKPPATARTSPYDYVATVVYHKSGDQKTDPWGADCANPRCYGVPLFRQYLTGKDDTVNPDKRAATLEMKRWYDNKCHLLKPGDSAKAECRFPFIRMAGEAISQRETLTINNGVYYLDTSISSGKQASEPYTPNRAASLNVFTAGKTYYVFFVYAKTTTVQTYQIYVGEDFSMASFRPGRMEIDSTLEFKDMPGVRWATATYDNGILTVRINFASEPAVEATAANGVCRPRTFCKPNPSNARECISALPANDPLIQANGKFGQEADAVCRNWAMKDLDCPIDGCRGFSFTLGPKFIANDKHWRPQPHPFPTSNPFNSQGHPDWTTKFLRTPTSPDRNGGRCHYDKLPGSDCPVP